MNNKICEVCSNPLIKQQERFCSKKCQHLGHRVKNPVWTKEFAKEYSKKYREENKEKLHKINKEWRRLNKDKITKTKAIARKQLKNDVVSKYSNGTMACVKCGFNNSLALQIDHINNNGAEERKRLFGSRLDAGTRFYYWLKKNKYPEGYQVLCANCNIIKLREYKQNGN